MDLVGLRLDLCRQQQDYLVWTSCCFNKVKIGVKGVKKWPKLMPTMAILWSQSVLVV